MGDLTKYNAKRQFMITPEPFGDAVSTDPDALKFVVNRHFAAREHFDLRLEWNGVLMSWAVPEGPSLDTKVRRFAVSTEDHPVSYLDFEGKIPEGEYGAGEIIVWDQGTWVPVSDQPEQAMADGELKFRLAGTRLKGGFTLVKLPKGHSDWLWIKERDSHASKEDMVGNAPGSILKRGKVKLGGHKVPIPTTLRPQLASANPSPPEGDAWVHEIKYDGYRTLIRIEDGKTRALTRKGHDWTAKYQSVVDAAGELHCDSAVLDGEIVVQDPRGASSFALLQKALSEKRDAALLFYAFDLLYLNGRDVTSEPLSERKKLLRRLMPTEEGSRLQYSDHTSGNGRQLFTQVCRLGLEGVVSKRVDAPYRMARSTEWVKAKRYDVGRFSVVGYTTKSSPRHVASLVLAERHSLEYVGKVGSGITNQWAAELLDTLSEFATDKPLMPKKLPSGGTWIAPGKAIAEISFRGRTDSGAVRQASLLSVKTDSLAKPAKRRKRLMTDRDLASVQLTNPDREVFKGSGTSKLDIALYYARVGDLMLPHVLDRPVTLIRCTTGKIEDCFYQRHAMQGLPDGVEAIKEAKTKEVLVIRNARGLLGLTQFGAIEFHPWDARADDLDRPDRLTIDLDPDEALDWPTIAAAAFKIKERLAHHGMAAFVRTTGGKGLHLVVPLMGKQKWAVIKKYLKGLAQALAKDDPRLFVTSSRKSDRTGRIFVDMGRTLRGSSATACFSLRAREHFPAAVTLDWTELQHFTNRPEFDRKSAVFRVEQGGQDPWDRFKDARAILSDDALRDVGNIE
jgi:bifunctional non-homologous end joining protein LigD